jgi:quinol monooxygenase YgiN
MYGTIARIRVKPGGEAKLRQMSQEYAADIPGFVFQIVYRSDADPNENWLVVGFESKEAYHKNAQSPEQAKRYEQYLTLLEGPPEWHDGEIILDERR